ncbi:tetA [Symbiodinium sp. CCMP2456]|nr:tetA [Symbiodinium sp. CCMP2456]
MSSAEEGPSEAKPLSKGEQAQHESYGALGAADGKQAAATSWEAEYASPWAILFNTLALVGYQIVAMAIIAYQVFYRRHYVMACIHNELCTWQLWACEYTKAFTRFFPLIAILISMSLARSMILVQRMYYELLRHGAVLQFREYQKDREPVFYILTFCFVQGAANWVLDAFTPTESTDSRYWTEPSPYMSATEKLRQGMMYLALPMTAFILSIYFTHEPTYYLVPLSRYLHASTPEGCQAARRSLAGLVLVHEDFIAPAVKHIEVPVSSDPEAADRATRAVYRELIKTAQDLEGGGSVMMGKKRMIVLKSQITDRFWPARLLFNLELADEGSQQFRLVSRFYDFVCIFAAAVCAFIFIQHAVSEFRDIQRGEIEDSAALVVEDRPVRLAYSSGSIALGLMLGPVVGAGLSHEGFSAAVRVCAVLSLVNWLFVFSSLAESENVLLRRQPKEESRSALESLPRLAWPLFFGAFLGNAGIAAAESCGALFVMDSYFRGSSAAAAESTQFFAYNMMISGVLVIMITNFVFPMLMHTLRQQKTMFLGVCLRIVGYAGLGLAPTKWCFLASQLAVVTGDSLAAPNLSALLTEVVGKSSYGIALGTLSTFQAAARVLDTLPFATMYEKISHSAPFLTVAVLAVASGALWFVVYWQMQLQSFRTCALGHEMPAEIPTRSGYPVS